MKKNILTLLILFFASISYSQNCKSNLELGTFYATNSGYNETVTSNIAPGQYIIVENVLENLYTFTSSQTGVSDYITIRDYTGNTILAQGESPLNYQFQPGQIDTNTIQIHIHLDSSCDSTDNGNHTVTLLNVTNLPTCYAPENPKVNYLSNKRIDFYWETPSTGSAPINYDWEIGIAGFIPGTDNEVVKGSTGGVTYASSGETLTLSTAYKVAIRSNCGSGDYSIWYQTPSITTLSSDPPANDFCDGAISLIQETGISDAGSATEIPGTVLGGAGTNTLAETCNGETANARDDVWYSFLAQTTDVNITLDPIFDGRLTLFSGDCNTLTFLTCSDNNGGLDPRGEQINYNSLVIGQTYYFRVYSQGFKATNPNFTIKLWSETPTTDNDNDGYSVDVDCDDANDTIYPGATEIPDNTIDEDCDGYDLKTWYLDSDADTYGDISNTTLASLQPDGYVSNSTDCDDTNAAIHTTITYYIDSDGDSFGSTTTADLCETSAPVGYSNNNTDCDDDNPAIHAPIIYYVDADYDGYGSTTTADLCETSAPTGYSDNNTDCDDTNAAIHSPITYYVDSDGDGFGSTITVDLCETSAPVGYSDNNTDCDDDNPTIHSPIIYYVDADNDGYGSNIEALLCESSAPSGYSENSMDCNDSDPNVNPEAIEILDNGKDDDCNPATLDSSADTDDDGDGQTENEGDCDDTDPTINTNAIEICDGKDNNCDGQIDEGVTNTYYADSDSDGYGNPGLTKQACSKPIGYVSDNTDCDDTNAAIHAPITYYVDADNDGYGSTTTIDLCETSAPIGYSDNNTDCDDTNAAIHSPITYYVDADEDGFGSTTTADFCVNSAPLGYSDNNTDCDDTNAAIHAPITYYVDADGDGFGSTTTANLCETSAPVGYSDNKTDCDDTNADIHSPIIYYVDADNDGFGSSTEVLLCESTSPSGYSENNMDCDDADPNINTNAIEICDGKDNNCDGLIDKGFDSDNDGVADCYDICAGFDDSVDSDFDGVPDGCDLCAGYDDTIDSNDNGIPDGCDSLSIDDLTIDNVFVYPNPFNSELLIRAPSILNNQYFKISFLDLNGRVILKNNLKNSNGEIKVLNLEKLQQGMYFIKIESSNHSAIIKSLIKL
ncbi:MopE-related protein [Gaetbulibacter sp. M235]|uniref:MopE-related protein n=1 Tax=Gaetbulibacter sp. M235 TaxID=3126510 RepID=UPI00374EC9F0